MKNNILSAFISLGLMISLTSFSPAAGLDKDVVRYTNEFRKSRGLVALIENSDLDKIARRHSEDMARGRSSFGHSGFNQRMDEARRSIKGMGTFAENVAYGVNTGKAVVSLWKNSSGHRKNMLGHFRYVGIGTARDSHGAIYYTQIFAN